MSKNRYQKNPARKKSRPEQIADYRRNLRQRPVSGTEETQSLDTESTDYTPPSSTPPPREAAPSQRLHNTNLLIGITVGILAILGVIVGTVYKFASLSTGMENLGKNVSENKSELLERINKSEEELRKDIRQINDRIDNYYSKGQKR